jgi:molecular chaperone HtpG
MAKKPFKAEVNRLLKLIIHSLYSHNEIFLRELTSNASDALDKMKMLSLTDEHFKNMSFDPRIDIWLNETEKTVTITDNGIGMNDKELTENLGQIAHSGTHEFLEKLSGDAKKDSNLIGQFGVGFYSVFMVANKVQVISKRAGEEQAYMWESDGETGYTITNAELDRPHGTTITAYINDDNTEYTGRWRIEDIIKRYSNHIAVPIYLHYQETKYEGEGDDRTETKVDAEHQVNSAKALWKRAKSELTEEDYREFYKNFSSDHSDPLFYTHNHAEGSLEYTTLFYIPAKAPFDLYQANYKPGVKLYVKRVFITDDDKELLPTYLRFVKGVIDSEDLPLNVSREILQQNRILSNIRSGSVKKLLGEIKKLAESQPEAFTTFVEQYNRVMKEGLYSDFANKDDLLEIIRFKGTMSDEWVSLAQYKDRMVSEQKAIYYLVGENEQVVRSNPLLAAYKKKGYEVLLLADEIDTVVIPMISDYQGITLKAINDSSNDDIFDDEKAELPSDDQHKNLLEKLQTILADQTKEVRYTARLTDAPACLVNAMDGMNIQLQRMMKMMGQEAPDNKPILELNAKHDLVIRMLSMSDETSLADYAQLLLDGAYLAEGLLPKEPHKAAERLFKKL